MNNHGICDLDVCSMYTYSPPMRIYAREILKTLKTKCHGSSRSKKVQAKRWFKLVEGHPVDIGEWRQVAGNVLPWSNKDENGLYFIGDLQNLAKSKYTYVNIKRCIKGK